MKNNHTGEKLLDVYERLLAHYGPQHWWPAEEPFEVMVGAVLTQSTAWTNVEKCINNLKKVNILYPQGIRQISERDLAELIYPCGYYNAKAKKIKALAEWFGERFHDNPDRMRAEGLEGLREELLKVYGIGEETADSILLYACVMPVFVIDAYTRRIVDRLGIQPEDEKYRHFQALFMDNLPTEVQLFNEFHALLVALGKDICRKRSPECKECCLRKVCKQASGALIYNSEV